MQVDLFIALPNDIIQYIWELTDPSIKCITDRKNYFLYYNELYNKINNKQSYIRNIIKYDDSFILRYLLKSHGFKWVMIKKYIYKNNIYNNYLYFIYYFSNDKRATKCINEIRNYFDITGFGSNLHKKNRIKNIRWTN
tara:strand:+ start:1892 stop:2305 length:414 start_codon:yes stop_codon:yes gene_type:complete